MTAPPGETPPRDAPSEEAVAFLTERLPGMERTAEEFNAPDGRRLCAAIRTVLAALSASQLALTDVSFALESLVDTDMAHDDPARAASIVAEMFCASQRAREESRAVIDAAREYLRCDDVGGSRPSPERALDTQRARTALRDALAAAARPEDC